MSFVIGTATNKSAAIVSPGLYISRLISIDEVESPFDEGKMQLKWIFRVERVIDTNDDDPEAALEAEIWGYTSKGGSLRHKARQWATAIRGKEYEEDEPMDAAELLGKLVKVSVVPHTKQDGTETTKIGALTTHKTKTKSAPAPVVEEAEDDDSDDF